MNNVHLFFDVYIEDAELGVYLRGDRVRFNKDKKIRGRNTQYRYQTKLDITRYTLYSYSHIDWTSVTIRIFCENDPRDNCVSHFIEPSLNLCRVISSKPKLLILPI